MSHGPRKFFELEILSAENKGGHDPDGVPPFDVLAASVSVNKRGQKPMLVLLSFQVCAQG